MVRPFRPGHDAASSGSSPSVDGLHLPEFGEASRRVMRALHEAPERTHAKVGGRCVRRLARTARRSVQTSPSASRDAVFSPRAAARGESAFTSFEESALAARPGSARGAVIARSRRARSTLRGWQDATYSSPVTALPMTLHTLATASPHAPKAATHLRVHAPLGTQSEHRSLQLSSTRPPRATRAERGAPPPELRAGIRGHRGHDAGKDTPEAKRKAGLGDMDAPRG
jgi:hypothetical protein